MLMSDVAQARREVAEITWEKRPQKRRWVIAALLTMNVAGLVDYYYRFVVEVVGPEGSRRAFEGPWHDYGAPHGFASPERGDPRHRTEVERIVSRLIADGWKPLPARARWYSCRFERRLPLGRKGSSAPVGRDPGDSSDSRETSQP